MAKKLDLDDLLAEGAGLFAERGDDMAEQGEALERAQRLDDARDLNRQLPPWLRGLRSEEVRLRISDDRLAEGVFAWDWGQNFLTMGPTGVGKTCAAALLWRRLMGRGVQIGGQEWRRARRMVWTRAVQLATARRKHPLGHGDAPEMVAACEARLLVLDDVDREPESRRPVSEVLAARYDAGLPTVVTTGLNQDELTEAFGAAVVRRMVASGGRRALVVDVFAPVAVLKGTPPTDGKTLAAGGG